MKVKDFIKNILEAIEKDPSINDMEVVYSIDDEGNGYGKVNYTSSVAYFDGEMEYIDEDEIDEYECKPMLLIN